MSVAVSGAVPLPLVFAACVGWGISGGLAAGLAIRASSNGWVAPLAYVLTSRLVAGELAVPAIAPWYVRAFFVLIALLTMTGMLLVFVSLYAAEDRHMRRKAGAHEPMVARPVPRWGPPLVAGMLVVLSVVAVVVP